MAGRASRGVVGENQLVSATTRGNNVPPGQDDPILLVDAIDRVSTESAIAASYDGVAWRLGRCSDSLAGIVQLMDGRKGVVEVHIVCRGGPGRLELGASLICLETLTCDARTRRQLRAIGRRLGPRGALVLGGADVGRGDEGLIFLQALADLMGIEVSAMVRCRPRAPLALAH